MKFKDYYDALGIERTVTTAEIKQAYRKLARKYHPDVSKDPRAESKFKDIAETQGWPIGATWRGKSAATGNF